MSTQFSQTAFLNLVGALALGTGANYIYNNDLQTGALFLAGGTAIHLVNYLFDCTRSRLQGLHGRVYCSDKQSGWIPIQGKYKTCKTALDESSHRVARLVMKPGVYAKQCGRPELTERVHDEMAKQIKRSDRIIEKLCDVPGIVRRYGSIETTSKKSGDPKFYIYEEFYAEGDLLTFLEHHKLSKEQQADLSIQLLTAVAGMHGRGVIHGDLKPENILIRRDGDKIYLAICDFDDSWMEGEQLLKLGHTTYYLSPERARSFLPMTHPKWRSKEKWTEREMIQNDLWATGIILHAICHQCELHPLVANCIKDVPISNEELFIRGLADLETDIKRRQCSSQNPMDRLVQRLLSPRPPSAEQAIKEFKEMI